MGAGEAFLRPCVTFRKLRIFFKNWGFCMYIAYYNCYHLSSLNSSNEGNWGFFSIIEDSILNFWKLSPEPKSSDLLIRWLQTSRRALQKLRIESSISVNTTKSTMGQVNHPFSGGKTLRKWTKIFLWLRDTYKKYILQKKWAKTVIPVLSSDPKFIQSLI